MAGRLREGIYEHVVTRGLAEALGGVGELRVDLATIEKVDLPRVLARHIAREIEVRLRDLAEPDDQVALANSLLAALDASGASGASDAEEADQSARVDRAQRLHAIYRALPPARPMTPLGESTLLTRSSKDPVLGHELKSEIASSDTVDVIAAFITMGGIRQLWRELEALSNRGGKVRVLTTVFTGSTEVRAVEALAKLPGCEVRISYDVERTRLHAKAWLFSRDRGGEDLHTAYVGSANLTHTALSSGQEWTIKASAGDLPDVVRKFRGTFEALWNDPEFEAYDGSEAAREKLRAALADERGGADGAADRVLTLPSAFRPKGYQRDILDKLVAERELHGHKRNLVVLRVRSRVENNAREVAFPCAHTSAVRQRRQVVRRRGVRFRTKIRNAIAAADFDVHALSAQQHVVGMLTTFDLVDRGVFRFATPGAANVRDFAFRALTRAGDLTIHELSCRRRRCRFSRLRVGLAALDAHGFAPFTLGVKVTAEQIFPSYGNHAEP